MSGLRHWRSPRTGPLLVPEIVTGPGVVYSFQDVLALRTFVRLRENASLQKIRAAIGNLRDIGEVDHLAFYRLVSDKGGTIQLVAADQAVNPTPATCHRTGSRLTISGPASTRIPSAAEKREVFARFLTAASTAQMAAARYRSHYDPGNPQGDMAEEQSAAVVAMAQAHSVLILVAPKLTMNLSR